MLEGMIVFLLGTGIGYAACLYAPKPRWMQSGDKYEKYRNKDGLLSRRAGKAKEKGVK